ncbi:hypothetical protein R5R35_014690 [Gryllus longicercus]|uniref:Uncharacterized protein n=1 Tax=Gryllus longicercus TaxID=2509291 RepID=A0AAN9Z1F6_9ORTH
MYYQLNNFTLRLIGCHGTTPYYPIDSIPARKMSSSKTIPGTNVEYGQVPLSIRLKMERFQLADGVPVHLKGGPLDKVLFTITVGLCLVGLGLSANMFYGMSYPKKA